MEHSHRMDNLLPSPPETSPLQRRTTSKHRDIKKSDDIDVPSLSWKEKRISISKDGVLVDEHGRQVLLRGVNLCAKLPNDPNQLGYRHNRSVSFVDRPLPRDEMDTHFNRLKMYGFSLIRLGITWESLEHAGPGVYDEEYIRYIIDFLNCADKHGFKVIIDPHQDVWSRFTGGSGAPGWTFQVAGMDPSQFAKNGAAHIQTDHSIRDMLWPTNYTKLACETMFTLFFGGNTFAPGIEYHGLPVQDFLQEYYIRCFAYLARRVAHIPSVMAISAMNEPHQGFIETKRLSQQYNYEANLHFGFSPIFLESALLGEGHQVAVRVYKRAIGWPTWCVGRETIGSGDHVGVWKNGACLWRKVGVWQWKSEKKNNIRDAVILDDTYFSYDKVNKRPYDFNRDFALPFYKKFAAAVREATSHRISVMIEPVPNEDPVCLPSENDREEMGAGSFLMYGPHWYDLNTMFSKAFNGLITHNVRLLSRGSRNFYKTTHFFHNGARKNYTSQVSSIINTAENHFQTKVPCIFTECGIPMDMNQPPFYDDEKPTKSMDAVCTAMERSKVDGYVVWNYSIDNIWGLGDGWNGEDFSIFEQKLYQKDSSKESLLGDTEKWFWGGRTLPAVVRPHAPKVAGRVIEAGFCLSTHTYSLKFKAERTSKEPTEIFVPVYHRLCTCQGRLKNVTIETSAGEYRFNPSSQTLLFWHDNIMGDEHYVQVKFSEKEEESTCKCRFRLVELEKRILLIINTIVLLGILYLMLK